MSSDPPQPPPDGWNLAGKGSDEQYTHAEWVTWFHEYQAQAAAVGAQQANAPQTVFNRTLLENQQAIANQLAQQTQLSQQQQQAQQAQLAPPASAALLNPPPQVQQHHPHRKLDIPVLPDPEQNYAVYARAVEEFRHESKDYDEFAQVKALKGALPPDLQTTAESMFSVAEMKVAGVVDKFVDWLKQRYDNLKGTDIIDILKEWNAFGRTGSSLRKFVDEFEHFQVRLTRVSKQPAAGELRDLLLVKAMLPPSVEKEIITALTRQIKSNGKDEWSYEDLRAELIMQDGKTELLQRRVNHVDARPSDDTLGLNKHIQCRHFGNPYSSGCLRGRSCEYSHELPHPTRSSRLYPSRSPWIPYLQQAFPLRGNGEHQYNDRRHPAWEDEIREYSSADWDAAPLDIPRRASRSRNVNYGSTDRGRGRSTSPRSTSPRYSSRSRSPRSGKGKGKGKGKSRFVCFDFQKGTCRRGTDCKFSHDSSRSPSRGNSPRQPEKDFFSGAKWKREICRDWARGTCRFGASCRHVHDSGSSDRRTPSPRRSNFSPVFPFKRLGSRSPSGQRGGSSRSPRPPPRRQ